MKTLNHLFIDCPKSQGLWNNFQWEAGSNLIRSSVKDLCLTLCGLQSNNAKNIIKFNTTMATMWTIWTNRNNQIFKGQKSLSLENTWENICNLIGIWSSRSKLFKDYS